MTKKDFKGSFNPATMFINTVGPEETIEQPAKKPEKKKADAKQTAQNHKETTRAKVETKSKRLNLLIQPSLYEDLNKIATMQKDSINNLINNVLSEHRDRNKDLIEKYNKVFEG